MRELVYGSLLKIIRLSFTFGEKTNWQNREKSHNIMTMVVSAKSKYVNPYNYIFNPVIFILSLFNVSLYLYLLLTYSKAIVHFCYSFNLQLCIFLLVFSKTLILNYAVFSYAVMNILRVSILPEIPISFFSAKPPIPVQDTYINDKHFSFALLYQHGASSAGHE